MCEVCSEDFDCSMDYAHTETEVSCPFCDAPLLVERVSYLVSRGV